jgi:hypothetical protein
LKTNETIITRVSELQEAKQERFVLTRQYAIEGVIENLEKALGRLMEQPRPFDVDIAEAAKVRVTALQISAK